MKTILIITLSLLTLNTFAQKIEYRYSPSGNRTMRKYNVSTFRLANRDSSESAKDFTKIVMREGISVYPNPTSDKIVLTINDFNPSETNSMTLLDGKGNEVMYQKVTQNNTEMNVAHLRAGIYYFKVIKDKNTLFYKLVKVD